MLQKYGADARYIMIMRLYVMKIHVYGLGWYYQSKWHTNWRIVQKLSSQSLVLIRVKQGSVDLLDLSFYFFSQAGFPIKAKTHN